MINIWKEENITKNAWMEVQAIQSHINLMGIRAVLKLPLVCG